MAVRNSMFNMVMQQQRVEIVEIRRACIVVPNLTGDSSLK